MTDWPAPELVVDASVALAWAFEDESTEFSIAALESAQARPILVPAIWWFEVANAVAVSQRRGRVSVRERAQFVDLLRRLRPATDQLDVQSL